MLLCDTWDRDRRVPGDFRLSQTGVNTHTVYLHLLNAELYHGTSFGELRSLSLRVDKYELDFVSLV